MFDFQIKICGISNPSDAAKAIEFGADAIGLNFYPRSLRSVTIDKAKEICQSMDETTTRVGVFVDESAETINETSTSCELNYAQLHGDESTELIDQISTKTIRAIRVSSFESARKEIDHWVKHGIDAILLDAASGNQFGGTGKKIDWEKVAELKTDVPLILAGGLNSDNVSHAIATASPCAVDVASGIERFPGSKDVEQMRAFIDAAKAEFAR